MCLILLLLCRDRDARGEGVYDAAAWAGENEEGRHVRDPYAYYEKDDQSYDELMRLAEQLVSSQRQSNSRQQQAGEGTYSGTSSAGRPSPYPSAAAYEYPAAGRKNGGYSSSDVPYSPVVSTSTARCPSPPPFSAPPNLRRHAVPTQELSNWQQPLPSPNHGGPSLVMPRVHDQTTVHRLPPRLGRDHGTSVRPPRVIQCSNDQKLKGLSSVCMGAFVFAAEEPRLDYNDGRQQKKKGHAAVRVSSCEDSSPR